MSTAFVCFMGIATVFVGLIVLIFITIAMSSVCKRFAKAEETAAPSNAVSTPSASIANKQEIIAASCAVIAEELGTDAKNIKVTSFKKL